MQVRIDATEDIPLVEFMYLHTCHVRVTVGDSGLWCTCVTYFKCWLNSTCVDSRIDAIFSILLNVLRCRMAHHSYFSKGRYSVLIRKKNNLQLVDVDGVCVCVCVRERERERNSDDTDDVDPPPHPPHFLPPCAPTVQVVLPPPQLPHSLCCWVSATLGTSSCSDWTEAVNIELSLHVCIWCSVHLCGVILQF